MKSFSYLFTRPPTGCARVCRLRGRRRPRLGSRRCAAGRQAVRPRPSKPPLCGDRPPPRAHERRPTQPGPPPPVFGIPAGQRYPQGFADTTGSAPPGVPHRPAPRPQAVARFKTARPGGRRGRPPRKKWVSGTALFYAASACPRGLRGALDDRAVSARAGAPPPAQATADPGRRDRRSRESAIQSAASGDAGRRSAPRVKATASPRLTIRRPTTRPRATPIGLGTGRPGRCCRWISTRWVRPGS